MEANKFKMIDVGEKQVTCRKALAQGKIFVSSKVVRHLLDGTMPKGDPLVLAEISGIQGAKKAFEVIPLCHPLGLEHVHVSCKLDAKDNSITVYCMASAFAKTGVEMEALSGVNAALLAIYDICKNVEPKLTISEVKLLAKRGGKKGLWTDSVELPVEFKKNFLAESSDILKDIDAAVVTVSQRASSNQYEDKSGKMLNTILSNLGAEVKDYTVITDDIQILKKHISYLTSNVSPKLIITTGGTGVAKMDITAETIKSMCDRVVPGIGELLRLDGSKYTKYSWLSGCIAGLIDDTLIICLPGNPSAVSEGMDAIKKIIPHALQLIAKEAVI